jgi:hypothetical protein
MSNVEIGAVEVTLYVRAQMYVDPYFARLLLSTFELSEHQQWTDRTVLTSQRNHLMRVP